MTYPNKEQKINFIIEQEKQHHNSWKWISKADTKTIDELYEYWTQEMATVVLEKEKQ
jgi:hypothetical protein